MIYRTLMLLLVVLHHNAEATAVSRYGRPLLPNNFTHCPYVNPLAPKGGTLKLGTVGTFDKLNPFTINGANSVARGVIVTHDSLMKRSPEEPFALYPLIAQGATISPDASQLTIYLDPRARFHDGTPIRAEDIKFTIDLLTEKGLPRYRQLFPKIETLQIINDTTLKLTFKKKENGYDLELPFLILRLLTPLSKKSLEGVDFTATGLTPILGSGPYRVKKVDQGHFIVYERVKDYWAENLPTNVGQFNYDSIRIDYYKNTATCFQSFLAGEFDAYFDVDPKHWHSAYESSKAVQSGQIKKYKISLNRPVTVQTIIFNIRRPIFADIRVRKALNYAFDFETFNQVVMCGELRRPTSLFANTVLAHHGIAKGKEREYLSKHGINPNLEPYTPPTTNGAGGQRENLSYADQLLIETGWIIKNGKRVKDLGNNQYSEQMKLEFLIKDPKIEKLALALQSSLSKLGIRLVVRLIDAVQYEARTANRDFDMILHSWTNTLSPGYEQAYYFGVKAADTNGSSNYIGVKDPAIEALANELSLCKDYETFKTAVHAFDRVIMNQHYFIPFAYDPNMYFAAWADRIDHPPINPKIGINIIEYGWCKTLNAKSSVRGFDS